MHCTHKCRMGWEQRGGVMRTGGTCRFLEREDGGSKLLGFFFLGAELAPVAMLWSGLTGGRVLLLLCNKIGVKASVDEILKSLCSNGMMDGAASRVLSLSDSK